MKAMILAAGRGERMRPLSDTCPKPLLRVGGKPLIVWHIERLAHAGIDDIVINHAHLGHMLEEALGNGSQWGVRIHYSPEKIALETAGGIANARALLGTAPFLVVNGDIYCDINFAALVAIARSLLADRLLAHLIMVANPPHHPQGDFALQGGYIVEADTVGETRYTFSGVGAYQSALFDSIRTGEAAKLAPLLRIAMQQNKVGGTLHSGIWNDIGTPQRLAELDTALQLKSDTGKRPGTPHIPADSSRT